MPNKKRKLFMNPTVMLPLLVAAIGAVTAGITTYTLFNTAISEDKTRLAQMVSSQASLIESVAQFDAAHSASVHPAGAFGATMIQIVEAHKSLSGFGETGEFVIGKIIEGRIALLQSPRFDGDIYFKVPEIVPIPMQMALAGKSGEIIAIDYKGNEVLASFAPVPILDIGLVAKIDTSEIYQPFIVSGGMIVVLTTLMIGIGIYASRQFSVPFMELETEKKRVEKYLDIVGAIIVILDKDGNIQSINRRGCDVLGRNEKDIIGKNWFETAIPVNQREQIKGVFAQLMGGDIEPVEYYENEIIDVNGETHLIAWHNSYISDVDGNITNCLSSGEDITEQKKYENALQVSQTRFNKSQEFANIGTWDWNIQTGDLYWSDRIAPLFGYGKGELETTYDNFLASIHPDDRQAVIDAVNDCVEKGIEYNIEHRTIWPDGTIHWLHESGDVVRDENGNPLNMLGVVQDITERMTMQSQLVQSSKMATLGEMATGVAHELNQPLNVIRMAVNNIQNKSDKNNLDFDYLKEKLSKVDKMVERAAAIIDHMRIFGRTTAGDMEILDGANVISSALGLIGEQLRLANIEIVTRFNAPETYLLGYQVQLEQVILNLIGNARDVLKEKTDGKKRITIS
ncbi:MAG: PAS domain-containing protein, partial [Rhodospirillaceae bacterium]|nr:PAS domain-containing protein [Rhodospirillaceae bacterium]